MFLKQGTFNYEKQSVVLSELSGLQRIEYLAFVQQRTAKFDAEEGELPEAERQIAFLRMGMDINAWLVSRSLWNAEQSQDVETLCAATGTGGRTDCCCQTVSRHCHGKDDRSA